MLISVSTICNAQNDTNYFKYIIQALAHDSMQGREPGTIYETQSANFIIQEIEKIRNEQTIKRTTQYPKIRPPKIQRFEFLYADKIHYGWQKGNGKNVYCTINNNADSTILISAHYDHIGIGNFKSLDYANTGKVHNGADDNASGVTMALNLLRNITQWNNKKYNYVFVFYSAHELGLHGSKAFEQLITKKTKNIVLTINFDMVGRLDKREKILTVYGYNNLIKKNTYFDQIFDELKIDKTESAKIKETDGLHFFIKKINSLSFTTGTHLDYHKTTDDEKYINYTGMYKIYTILFDFLKTM